MSRKDVEEAFNKARDLRVLIGHCRYATQGAIKDDNAHPFEHDHMILAHNGGIFNKNELPDGHKFEVDSEAICHSIAKIGAIETLKKVNGAFALSYVDWDEDRFNLIRNTARSLYISKHSHKKVWYYASEDAMLLWLLRRNDISHDKIEEVELSTLYSYDLHDNDLEIKKVDYQRKWDRVNKEYWHNYGNNGTDSCSFLDSDPEPRPLPKEVSKSTEIIPFVPTETTNTGRVSIESFGIQDIGPHGTGFQFLAKWGLALRDYICVQIPEAMKLTDKIDSGDRAKGFGFFGFKGGPDDHGADIVIYGFTLEEYKKLKRPDQRFFTQIKQCFYSKHEQKYIIRCFGIFDVLPKGAVAETPLDSLGYFKKDATVELATTEVITTEDLQELSEKLAANHAALENSFAQATDSYGNTEDGPSHMDDLVDGPWGSKIAYRRWLEETAGGCGRCTHPLSLKNTVWYSEAPIHPQCLEEYLNEIKDSSKKVSDK